jgi:hypothetical protein
VPARIADGFFDGTMGRGRLDFLQRHRPVGFVAEYDGPEDYPFGRTIDNASHLAPGLRGKAGDKLRGQVLIVVV